MKVAGRILATMIAMAAILLIAVGADKGLNYLEQRKQEKQNQEVYARNQADAELLRTQIEEISQDEQALQAFMQEHETADDEDEEDVLREYLTASTDPLTDSSVSEDAMISENAISQNEPGEIYVSGNSPIVHSASGNSVSGNTVSSSDISGNHVSGNDISGNGISGNDISGNSVSANGITVSTVSGNILVRPTLRERRLGSSSYMATVEWNDADQFVLQESTADFADKKITCLGDSITQAANLESMENYQQYSYPTRLGQVLGAKEMVNLGIGGSSIGRYWQDAFVDRYMQIPEDTDLILVMGGTNDGFCLHKENVGNFEERLPHTLIGDLDELMRGLKEHYPDAEVVFVTPLPNVLHDILRKERPELLSQRVIVDSMIALADEYGFDVIDLYDSNLLDSHDAAIISNYMPDGVHCNPDGYQILAEHIAADLIRLHGEEAEPAESNEETMLPDILEFCGKHETEKESDLQQNGDSPDEITQEEEQDQEAQEKAAAAQLQQDMKIGVGTYGQ